MAVRREKARPFIPIIALNGFQTPLEMLQAGIFGFGPNSSMNQWMGRDDVSIQPVWQLRESRVREPGADQDAARQESLAIIDLFDAQDMVAEEVNEAHARLQSAAVRVVQADRALRTGIITFNGTVEGLQQTSRFGDVLVLISRPQEAVYALQLLKVGLRRVLHDGGRVQPGAVRAVPRAWATRRREVAQLQPPGEALPVDTARPPYLPPVGNGPPPATR